MNRKTMVKEGPGPLETAISDESHFLEKEIHLLEYLNVLRSRKNIVYTTFLIILTLTLVITYSMQPMYEASSKLLIQKNEKNPLLSEYGVTGRDPEFLATQSQIIKSTPVGLKVVRMLNLEATYDDFFKPQFSAFSLASLGYSIIDWIKTAKNTTLKIFGLAQADHAADLDTIDAELLAKAQEIAETITEKITVRPERNSRIVTLNYMASNPVLAAKIVNSVTKAYIDKTFDMKLESSSYTLKWMTEKAQEEQEKLENSERSLQKYMEQNDIVTIENKVTITPQKLAEINTLLINTQARRKELKAIYNRVKDLPKDLKGAESVQVISSDPTIQMIRDQILEAEKRIMDLSKKFRHKHPTMQRANADLKIIINKRKQEIHRVIQSVKNEYELVSENEKEFENLLAQIKQDAVKLNEKFIQYGILQREVDTNKQLYNALLTKIKEQNIAEQAQNIKVWVVEEAKIPEKPSKPNKQRNLFFGLVLGLFTSIGMAFFLEYLDDTLKYPDDVEERFDLPVLGTVPKLKTDDSKPPEKEVIDNPTSLFSESFKTIRTSVLLSSADSPPKSLLVTSVVPSEGKSTSIINLAASLAHANRRVLLIDADLRKPRIHQIFGLENEIGLSNFLAGAKDSQLILRGPHQNFDFITAGPIPPNPSELLSSNRTEELIRNAELKYDMVLIDTPPLLTVSDALIVSKLVERIILVARSGVTSFRVFTRGIRTFKNIGSKLDGLVINAIEAKKHDYYTYYSNYYIDNSN